MTAKQLEEEVRSKYKHAESLLQMPPVVKVMEEKKKIISTDPAISNFSENSFVFTDVTFGLKNSDRSVVIRHPDGVLENAPYSVRKRVYQIYFPMVGRKFRVPKMFEPENLQKLMESAEYEFLLNKLCLQYEPYEQQFHEITAQIYQHVNEHQQFETLRSTRHFGPMAFFFAWHKLIDDLVLDMIRKDYLKNAVELICLMYKLNAIDADSSILKTLGETNETERRIRSVIDQLLKKEEIKKIEKTNEDLAIDELCFGFIQDSFVNQHSLKKPQLELALQTYKERHNELKNIVAGVN
jgi:small subunit ribosomal protein S22